MSYELEGVMHGCFQHSALESCPRRVSDFFKDCWEEGTHRVTEGTFEESYSDSELDDTGDSEESGD